MTKKTYIKSYIVFFALLYCFIPVQSSSAEETFAHGQFGLSASVQSNQLDISIPIWMTDRFVLSPAFYFTHVSNDNSYSDFCIGALFRYNGRLGRAVPYFGVRVGAIILSPDKSDSSIDMIFGPVFGGEYFFNSHFSMSVEGQVNIAVSDEHSGRFGNPDGTNMNTASTVVATYYF